MEQVGQFIEKVLANKKALVWIASLFGLFVFFTSFVGIYNTQAQLKVTYEAKVKSNEADFDNMWKKISQVTQIPTEKKEAFRQIFVEYAEARTSDDAGKVMNWVQENAPNLDLNIYDNAMNIVAGSRDTWTMHQVELVDISRQFNQNMVMFPRNIFLSFFFDKINPKVISSGRTREAFESEEDNDVELFKPRKAQP